MRMPGFEKTILQTQRYIKEHLAGNLCLSLAGTLEMFLESLHNYGENSSSLKSAVGPVVLFTSCH